jgi:hypothetical protein
MRRDVPIVGFLIGLFLPMVGFYIMYLAWGNHEGIGTFISNMTHLRGMASKVMTLSLLINLIPFLYCTTKRLDYTMRGIVIATMLYALFIILIKFVW